MLEKQEERISRTHRATRRPAAPASATSQQLPPATSCLSVYPLVSVPLTTRPRLPALGVELPSVFSPAVGRGFIWRLLTPAPRPHRDQPLRCAHWAPSFRQRRGAQQAWPLWSPRPAWKPTRGSAPHRKPGGQGSQGWAGVSLRTATTAAPECGLGLKTQGAQRMVSLGMRRRDEAQAKCGGGGMWWSTQPEALSFRPSCPPGRPASWGLVIASLPPRTISSPWLTHGSATGPTNSGAGVRGRVLTRTHPSAHTCAHIFGHTCPSTYTQPTGPTITDHLHPLAPAPSQETPRLWGQSPGTISRLACVGRPAPCSCEVPQGAWHWGGGDSPVAG